MLPSRISQLCQCPIYPLSEVPFTVSFSSNRKTSQTDCVNWITRAFHRTGKHFSPHGRSAPSAPFDRHASEREAAAGDRRGVSRCCQRRTVARGGLPRQTDGRTGGRRKRRRSLGLQCSLRNQRTKCVCREEKGVSENDGPSECTRRE